MLKTKVHREQKRKTNKKMEENMNSYTLFWKKLLFMVYRNSTNPKVSILVFLSFIVRGNVIKFKITVEISTKIVLSLNTIKDSCNISYYKLAEVIFSGK